MEQKTVANATRELVTGWRGVRYQVGNVERSIGFYTEQLGFELDMKHPPAFAQVSLGDLKLILSGPSASGSRPMPEGEAQEPGGWNRIILQVADLTGALERMKAAGIPVRNTVESGPGGRQVQIEDPDGNPIELLEPADHAGSDRPAPANNDLQQPKSHGPRKDR